MNKSHQIAILESSQPDEKRIPIILEHLNLAERSNVYFQNGYGKYFGYSDNYLEDVGFKLAPREALLSDSDIIFLLKPTEDDFSQMKFNSTLVGWCHATNTNILKIAKKRRLTLIAMENMFRDDVHLFNENNYMAGALAIEHALASVPTKYFTDSPLSIISYGLVSQGAIHKLLSLGYRNITLFYRHPRNSILEVSKDINCELIRINNHEYFTDTGHRLKDLLIESNIIVNGIKQDIQNPYFFLTNSDLKDQKDTLIIDISCDENMGFDFAKKTYIRNPIRNIGNNFYYGVSNIPSLDYKNASEAISKQLSPMIPIFYNPESNIQLKKILTEATEILNGDIINIKLAEFHKNHIIDEAVSLITEHL